MRISPVLQFMIFAALVSRAAANEYETCLLNKYGPSVAEIEYTYTDANGGKETIQGSGYLIDEDGDLVTANHVLSPAVGTTTSSNVKVVGAHVEVKLGSKSLKAMDASIISRDESIDYAILKIPRLPGVNYKGLTFDKTGVNAGADLYALGYPKTDLTFSGPAALSALNAIAPGVPNYWYQTSLNLNEGNSGGPAFNKYGAVIGIAIAYNSDAVGISYVVPIKYLYNIQKLANQYQRAYGECGEFPSCDDASHPITGYAISTPLGQWSNWMDGGHNRDEYCKSLESTLKSNFPNSLFTKIQDDENSQKDVFGHVTYRYYCQFLRQESPIHQVIAGPECIK